MSPSRKSWKNFDIEIDSDFVSIESEKTFKVLSSGVLNPGFIEARSILNYRVEKDFDDSKPWNFLEKKIDELGFAKPVVGMLTAANVENAGAFSCQKDGVSVNSIVTAGISFPISTGMSDLDSFDVGTINSIVLIDSEMSSRSMIDAVRTVTEAKTNALREVDLRDRSGSTVASGTPTDAVAIACTGEGNRTEFAGPVTLEGSLIGESVLRSTKVALENCGFDSSRSMKQRLEERGLSIEKILDTAEKAYVKHPDLDSDEKILKKLEEELERALSDLNICALLLAGCRLEEDGKKGLIPNLSSEEFDSDPVHLLSDEILGMRIANYLNGSKGVFEFARIDKAKPGILGELGPFLDDIIGGLIGGICSRTYERRD